MVHTSVLSDGRIVDWVDVQSLPGRGAPAPKPPVDETGLAEGETASEIEKLEGPEGTVPYVRPTFEQYVNGESTAFSVEEYYENLPHGNPHTTNSRLYVNTATVVTNYGGAAFINDNWSGTTTPSAGQFVIVELAAYCYESTGDLGDLVGVVVGRLPGIYATGHVLGLEYIVGASNSHRWVVGGSGTWVQTHATYAPGVFTGSASSINGTQYTSEIYVWYVDNDPNYDDGWWVGIQGNTLGQIPSGTTGFTDLDDSACRIHHYVEALDPASVAPEDPWMFTDMGNANSPTSTSATTNYGNFAYIRKPTYWTQKNAGGRQLVSSDVYVTDRWCYGGTKSINGGADWNPTFWYGGDGGNKNPCNKDPSCLTGIKNSAGTACCDPRCGTCGGPGCSNFWPQGGAAACCTGNITASNKFCTNGRPPCEL